MAYRTALFSRQKLWDRIYDGLYIPKMTNQYKSVTKLIENSKNDKEFIMNYQCNNVSRRWIKIW